jgi:hypothetical protein
MWNRVLSDEAVDDTCRRRRRRRPTDIEDLLEDIKDILEDIEECTCDEIVPLLRRILDAVDEDDHHHRC